MYYIWMFCEKVLKLKPLNERGQANWKLLDLNLSSCKKNMAEAEVYIHSLVFDEWETDESIRFFEMF